MSEDERRCGTSRRDVGNRARIVGAAFGKVEHRMKVQTIRLENHLPPFGLGVDSNSNAHDLRLARKSCKLASPCRARLTNEVYRAVPRRPLSRRGDKVVIVKLPKMLNHHAARDASPGMCRHHVFPGQVLSQTAVKVGVDYETVAQRSNHWWIPTAGPEAANAIQVGEGTDADLPMQVNRPVRSSSWRV